MKRTLKVTGNILTMTGAAAYFEDITKMIENALIVSEPDETVHFTYHRESDGTHYVVITKEI